MAKVSNENWAKTFPMDNVQALAAKTNGSGYDIPPIYIRPELDDDIVVHEGDEKIPVINFSRLLDPHFAYDELVKLNAACEDWGFFQLVNHGIPDEVIERVKGDLQKFFQLPLHERQAFAPLPGAVQGYGRNFLVSYRQKLDWHDFLFLITHPPHERSLGVWPTNPPTFQSTLAEYSEALAKVARPLFEATAKNLCVDPDVFLRMFKDIPQNMRINYYPPCDKPNKVLGLSPHTDVSGLSLVLQTTDTQGLQIKKDGKWFPVEVLPRALVVNIGDVLELLSNGKYKSIEHRVVVNNEKERLAVVAFHSPTLDAMIGPLPEVAKGGEVYYKTLSYEDIKRHHFVAKLEGKSHMEKYRLKK